MTWREDMAFTGNNRPGFFYGYVVVFASFMVMVLAWGTFYSFGVFFKPLVTEFGWTRAATSGAVTLTFLIYGFLGIFAGRLSDRVGARTVVTACATFFGVGYLLLSQIEALWQLYLCYGVIVAVGMSGCWAPLISTVARWFVRRRGLMTGFVASGIGFGTVIVPPVATRIIYSYGWRYSYIIIGIAALVLIVLAAQFLKRDPGQLRLLPYGECEMKKESMSPETSGLSFSKAIHTSQFWIVCIMYFCYGFFLQSIMVHVVPHATELGVSPLNAANILAIIGGIGIVGRIAMGSASDRIGVRSSLALSFIVAVIVLIELQFARELWMLYLFAFIFGFAYGGLSAMQSLIIAGLFGLSSIGIIVGGITFIFAIGGAAGPLIAGHIFDLTGSYYIAFIICAILGVVGLSLALFLRPISE